MFESWLRLQKLTKMPALFCKMKKYDFAFYLPIAVIFFAFSLLVNLLTNLPFLYCSIHHPPKVSGRVSF